ncbi:MAG: substrate-binding domain-containing protein [Mycobacteriaceae bacterium]
MRQSAPSERAARGKIVMAAAVTIALLSAILVVRPHLWGNGAAEAASCASTPVQVAVNSELAGVAQELLHDPITFDNGCTNVEVKPVDPLVQSASIAGQQAAPTDSAKLPDLWIPSASLWAARAGSSHVQSIGSFASTQLVVATSRSSIDALNWVASAPSWSQVFLSGRPISVQDPASTSEGLLALSAVRASLGGGADADNALVSGVIAAKRGSVPSSDVAMKAAAANDPKSPLVPISEQNITTLNKDAKSNSMVAIYPTDQAVWLDYPILQVGTPTGAQAAAVHAVAAVLASPASRAAVQKQGFRDPKAPHDSRKALELSSADVQSLLGRLSTLAKPSRMLVTVDVSLSMSSNTSGGETRIELARDALNSAMTLIPDSYAVGERTFADAPNPKPPFIDTVPVAKLAGLPDGKSQRQTLMEANNALPGHLIGGGTGLYETALDSVRTLRASYDPTAVNAVVLITDGQNEDSEGITLAGLLQAIKAEADPARPVIMAVIGIGPEVDNDALKQMAEATGGYSYAVKDPRDLQKVLFDMVRRRK